MSLFGVFCQFSWLLVQSSLKDDHKTWYSHNWRVWRSKSGYLSLVTIFVFLGAAFSGSGSCQPFILFFLVLSRLEKITHFYYIGESLIFLTHFQQFLNDISNLLQQGESLVAFTMIFETWYKYFWQNSG